MTSQRDPERELLSLREFQIEAESNPNFHQKILQYHKIVRLFGHRGLVVGFGGPFKDNQLLSRPCNGEHVILEVRTAETGWFVGLVEARLYVTGSPEAFQNAERKEKEEAERKKAAGEENKRRKTAHEKEEEEEGKTENKQASSSSSSQIAKTEDRSEKPAEVQAEGAAENVEEIKFILPKVDIRLSSPMEENMGIEVEDVDVAGQEEVEETGQTGNETQQEESEVPKSTEEEIAQQKKDAKKRAAALNKMPTASLDLKTVYFLQPAKETEDCERDLVLLICLMTFLKSPNIKVFCSPGPATYLPKGPYGPDELEKQAEALALAPAAAAACALEDIPRTAAEAAAPPDESMAVDLGEGVVETSTAVAAVHHETSVPFRFEQDPKLQPTPKAIKKTKAKKSGGQGMGRDGFSF
uniref:Uncharacterized protein n=1 Tax=Chromera velia CCMP2878 TaxID=1169474 RepID=A0A0G4HBP7_9ALVE|eukprot:Cvel_25992.t1-p1 / transcript=Cvel_25992.t1 / gene=Cvel_25992 / organism=Chromera_velia_CCMP2878 / gene_product=hypothetical protein / transcript_product=hypothetical protein / location=Cvel_scaffold3022:18586-20268(+) / protein_length=411 / sequence_SO=supercontig / SO=protein_coding / is_pseudo=false